MMNQRLVVLYLRSRGVPRAVLGFAALLTAVALAGWDTEWLSWSFHAKVLIFATMLTAVLVGGGLGSPSPELDAAAPLPWWRWRLIHALTGLLSCAAALATVGYYTGGAAFAPVAIRNVLGFGGLAALAAVVVGAGLSWTLPLAYVLVVQPPLSFSLWAQVVRWPMLAGDAALSWWPALGLCTVGLVVLSARGSTPRPWT